MACVNGRVPKALMAQARMEPGYSVGYGQVADHVYHQARLAAFCEKIQQVARKSSLDQEMHANCLRGKLVPGLLILSLDHENDLYCGAEGSYIYGYL